MDAIEQEYIRARVQDVTAWVFEAYTFEDIIEDTGLSSAEVEWAKENLDWKVYQLDESITESIDKIRQIE